MMLFRERTERGHGKAFGATWIVSNPIHPVWSQYAGALYDLTTDTGAAPIKYRDDVTHEFLLFALDPRKPFREGLALSDVGLLHPANMGYQFLAESDDAAFDRIDPLMVAVAERRLSPDTDQRYQWDALFRDGRTLLKSAFDA